MAARNSAAVMPLRSTSLTALTYVANPAGIPRYTAHWSVHVDRQARGDAHELGERGPEDRIGMPAGRPQFAVPGERIVHIGGQVGRMPDGRDPSDRLPGDLAHH